MSRRWVLSERDYATLKRIAAGVADRQKKATWRDLAVANWNQGYADGYADAMANLATNLVYERVSGDE